MKTPKIIESAPIQGGPALSYLRVAVGSMAMSLGLAAFKEKKNLNNLIGLWVPAFVLLGLYNKIVSYEGARLVRQSN